jgi:hypothetical protein
MCGWEDSGTQSFATPICSSVLYVIVVGEHVRLSGSAWRRRGSRNSSGGSSRSGSRRRAWRVQRSPQSVHDLGVLTALAVLGHHAKEIARDLTGQYNAVGIVGQVSAPRVVRADSYTV